MTVGRRPFCGSSSFGSGSGFLLLNEPAFNGQHGEWRDSPCHDSLLRGSPQAEIIWPELPWRSQFKNQMLYFGLQIWILMISDQQLPLDAHVRGACNAVVRLIQHAASIPNWGCWANDQFHTLPQEANLFIQNTLFLYIFAFKICFHLFAWAAKWKPPLALSSIYTLNFSTQQNVALHCFHKNLINNPQLMMPCIISLRWNNTICLTDILNKCPPLSTRGKSV